MSIRDYVDTTCGNTTPPGEIPFEQWVRDQFQNMNNKIGELETRINQMGAGIGMALSGSAVGGFVRGSATPGLAFSETPGYTPNIGCMAGLLPGTTITIEDFNECFPPVIDGNKAAIKYTDQSGVWVSIPTSGTITRVSLYSSNSGKCAGFNQGWHDDSFSVLPWGIVRYVGNNIFTRAEYTRWNLPGAPLRAGFSVVENTSLWVNAGDMIITYASIPGAIGKDVDVGGAGEGFFGRNSITNLNTQIILSPGA